MAGQETHFGWVNARRNVQSRRVSGGLRKAAGIMRQSDLNAEAEGGLTW
jgi:hypothetical protein